MTDVHVADLMVDRADAAGRQILAIYARNPPDYCVYLTSEKVMIQYADDLTKQDAQRKAFAPLSPLRGEITGLIDGWRNAPQDKHFLWVKTGLRLRSKAAAYDRRVADALIVALEGDLTGAGGLLTNIKNDIIAERTGRARFEYLLMAYGMAAVLTAWAVFVSLVDRNDKCGLGAMLCFRGAWDLWRGGAAGAFGAFFSIALAIRGRTVLTDLHQTSNLMDAALRIVIGAIAGGTLVALINAGFVQFWIGKSSPEHFETIHILVVGFIGGFAERLVPDLLAKAEAHTGERPVIRQSEPEVSVQPPNTEAASPSAQKPAGAAPLAPDEADEDGCIADQQISDADLTSDEDLPPASGGVQKEELVK